MASNVNNQNVDLYCFICKDEIFVWKFMNSSDKSYKFYKVKCHISQNDLESSKKSNLKDVEWHIVSAAASSRCNFLSACDSDNVMHLWKCDGDTFEHLSERRLARKSQKIIFTNAESEVICADRGGDVFSFTADGSQKEGKFILGHISLITDIAISSDDKYLLTCDRDGKIRVSCYPNSYNILSYCLGHQEFVSTMQCVQLSQERILSASGDGSLRLWAIGGENIFTINLFENEILKESFDAANEKACVKALLPSLLDEKQITFAVKKVKYSSKTNLCVVSFYLIKGVAVYLISDTEKCQFMQFIPLDSIPFDVLFNCKGDLIIISKNSAKPFFSFKHSDEDKVPFVEADFDNDILYSELQKFCESVENLYEFQDDYVTLFKRNYDDKDDSIESENNIVKKAKLLDVK